MDIKTCRACNAGVLEQPHLDTAACVNSLHTRLAKAEEALVTEIGEHRTTCKKFKRCADQLAEAEKRVAKAEEIADAWNWVHDDDGESNRLTVEVYRKWKSPKEYEAGPITDEVDL